MVGHVDSLLGEARSTTSKPDEVFSSLRRNQTLLYSPIYLILCSISDRQKSNNNCFVYKPGYSKSDWQTKRILMGRNIQSTELSMDERCLGMFRRVRCVCEREWPLIKLVKSGKSTPTHPGAFVSKFIDRRTAQTNMVNNKNSVIFLTGCEKNGEYHLY
uniref:Pyridoxamine 5'-phosphate oxidase n=1 Tax=Heterorhabditis bacteriophora TaxID=37862 RepID=A0A1I7WJ58_HETBA